MIEQKNEDGTWSLTWTSESDPETVLNLLKLSSLWKLHPKTEEFNQKLNDMLVKAIENDMVKHVTELECFHDWECTKVGSTVSEYMCPLCGKEDRW
jgi:hypothetical protein